MKKHGFLPFLFLFACSQIKYKNNESTGITPNLTNSLKIDSFIKPYHDSLYRHMNSFICKLDTSYSKSKPNGNLNNLVANTVLNYANLLNIVPRVHFCVLNYGGLRASLPRDTVKLFNIYELSPFENQLVILKLKPSAVDSLFTYLKQRTGDPIAGLQFTQNQILIQNQVYDSRRSFYLVTNDYMANGGDGFSMLRNASFKYTCTQTQRQAIAQQLMTHYMLNQSIPFYNEPTYP